jgi:hypothetical protein
MIEPISIDFTLRAIIQKINEIINCINNIEKEIERIKKYET